MKRLALLLLLAGCSTAQVTATCTEAQRILQIAKPFLSVAPTEIELAVTVIGAGAYACGTPEYAAIRDRIVEFLKSKGITP